MLIGAFCCNVTFGQPSYIGVHFEVIKAKIADQS
jgi:hypothetical protein